LYGEVAGVAKHGGPVFCNAGPSRREQTAMSAGTRGEGAMAKTYREIAIEEMLRTTEEAMSDVIDWWGELPASMNDAIEQFRARLGAAIDSVEFVRRALDREVPETGRPEGPR
jgi:hypothetical protein